jgi:hypothetical protein
VSSSPLLDIKILLSKQPSSLDSTKFFVWFKTKQKKKEQNGKKRAKKIYIKKITFVLFNSYLLTIQQENKKII